MTKFPTAGSLPQRRAGSKMVQDLRDILRKYPSGDQEPRLLLSNESLKTELRNAGHPQVLGDQIEDAFRSLQQEGLVILDQSAAPIGSWNIRWISPQIGTSESESGTP